MTDEMSATALWDQVHESFESDDGSLPTVEIQNLTQREVESLYDLIRAGTRVVSETATFWDLSSEQERELDDVQNAGALVATGQAAPFHFAIEGVGTPDCAVPCIGVHVFQDSIAIDYKMGRDWGEQEVWTFFFWLRSLLSRTQAGVLKLGEESPPEGEKFMAAWELFQESSAACNLPREE